MLHCSLADMLTCKCSQKTAAACSRTRTVTTTTVTPSPSPAAMPTPLPPAFMRVIHHKRCGKMKYTRDPLPTADCCMTHLGQLKLLLSEIEFLIPFYGRPDMYVVYAGAAPGVHVPILAEMFSTMHFILVDPAPSMISNGKYPNIEVIQGFMTDELARHFASRYSSLLLFISDVRVGCAPGKKESDTVHQLRVKRDMDAQRGWVEIMRPLSSILKFRLPWSLEGDDGKTEYLGGRIYFPVYGKILTHEARLIVTRSDDAAALTFAKYDNKIYEKQMTFFNRVLRPAIYPAFGGNRCYDCTAFRWIICKYLAVSAGYDVGSGDYKVVDDTCNSIERKLDAYKALWRSSMLKK